MDGAEFSMNDKYKVRVHDNIKLAVFDPPSVKYFGTQRLSYVSKVFISEARIQKSLYEDFFSIIKSMSKDEAKSLLLIRMFLLNGDWDLPRVSGSDYPTFLAKYLRGCKLPLEAFNDIIYHKLNYCVPDTYLNWFEKDLRSTLFVAFLAIDQLHNNTFKGKVDLINNVTETLRYEIHIFNRNYSKKLPEYSWFRDIHGDAKIAHIEFVKDLYLKNRTAEKDISWIDPSNKKQIDWMHNYLDDKKFGGIILERIFFPESTNEKYQQILASLDLLSNVPNEKFGTRDKKWYRPRDYVISSMRNAWRTQLNYDKSKPLTKERYVKILKKNYEVLDKIIEETKSTDIKIVNSYLSDNYDLINASKTGILDEPHAIKLSSYPKKAMINS
ncbi:hypothetical protein FQ082_01475 [Psychrobacter sp. ANT_H56B]|uniref:hypothetical protein n=1 Tax=Psychrobacter sp. ANT_H56B TaxID=2597353 RepID=UPI0011F3F517|nr:hypothetical protein [Psychrobacter sp. ANT_H56B]KAA0929423.1 hypothetical protein FQ082_01475 [Psychrobacter sp. ANT_H56B]